MDSGTGTMATVSTGLGRSSKSIRNNSELTKAKGIKGNPCTYTLAEGSEDHLSDMWPRHARHPPSPPVRQRAR